MSALINNLQSPRPSRRWPESPYKGFNAYGPEDAPLFVGRDTDVSQCAHLLALSPTRILILEGTTGCGKTSFLQAGLIPYVEDEVGGFCFLRKGGAERLRFLLVRSTARPLFRLAEYVFEVASRDICITTPAGVTHHLNLPEVLDEYGRDRRLFLEKAGKSGERMVKVLADLAHKLPQVLVLVIDQCEEVLTLEPGAEGDGPRKEFFNFVRRFSRMECDLKFLFTIRTEFCSRFQAQIQQEWPGHEKIEKYYLEELTDEQLVRAVEFPTSEGEVAGYGRPRDRYRFTYEPGLPGKIVKELRGSISEGSMAGSSLPLLIQMVCNKLYQITKREVGPGEFWVITEKDYRHLGAFEKLMDVHLTQVLKRLCSRAGVSPEEMPKEIDKWKELLYELTQTQIGGTITKRLLRENKLVERARELECRPDWLEAVGPLAEGDMRILSELEVREQETGEFIRGYSLAHDTLGLVLQHWKMRRKASADLVEETAEPSGGPGQPILQELERINRIADPHERRIESELAARRQRELYPVSEDSIRLLTEKILRHSPLPLDEHSLRVLACEPEFYYEKIISEGEGRLLLETFDLDEAADKLEKAGGKRGAVARIMTAKAGTV